MKTYLVLLLMLSTQFVQSQNPTGFIPKEFISDEDTLKYNILYPQEMKAGVKYPLVLFLHGSGERGSDNQRQLIHGSKSFLTAEARKQYPAIVLIPQCPEGKMWTPDYKGNPSNKQWEFKFTLDQKPSLPAILVNQLVDQLLESEQVDTNRLYIMGLSMGGIGTLDFLCRWPNKYAAAQVICGDHNPDLVYTYQNVPIWFFHGAEDVLVSPINSAKVYEAHKKLNAQSKYTLYPEVGHNSWDSAFAEPDYLKWIFEKKLTKQKRK